jgi:ribonuclease P protein component
LAKTFTYNKKEKLKSRKQLEALFSKGKTLLHFPVKVFFLLPETPLNNAVKTGVGASSRSFKKAVQRNRIKRLLREAYRLNKQPLHQFLAAHNRQLVVFLLYIDKQMPQKNVIQAKMPLLLEKLMKELAKQFGDDEALNNIIKQSNSL